MELLTGAEGPGGRGGAPDQGRGNGRGAPRHCSARPGQQEGTANVCRKHEGARHGNGRGNGPSRRVSTPRLWTGKLSALIQGLVRQRVVLKRPPVGCLSVMARYPIPVTVILSDLDGGCDDSSSQSFDNLLGAPYITDA